MRAVCAYPTLHGVKKILISVIANAGFLVGGDISRVERSKRHRKGESADMFRAVPRGVADPAVGCPRQIFTAPYHICVFESGRNTRRVGATIIGEADIRSSDKCHRSGIEYLPGKNGCNDQQNDNGKDYAAPAHDALCLPAGGQCLAVSSDPPMRRTVRSVDRIGIAYWAHIPA